MSVMTIVKNQQQVRTKLGYSFGMPLFKWQKKLLLPGKVSTINHHVLFKGYHLSKVERLRTGVIHPNKRTITPGNGCRQLMFPKQRQADHFFQHLVFVN
jgi:hypothetical protein